MSEREKFIEKLIESVEYSPAKGSHIEISKEKCETCSGKVCINVCPAGVYVESQEGIVVRWERCLECGACMHVCRYIRWNYPEGGRGVVYRFG